MSTGLLELSLTPDFLCFPAAMTCEGKIDLWKSSHNDPIDAVLWSEVDELLFDPFCGPVRGLGVGIFCRGKAAFWGHVSNDVPCLSHPCSVFRIAWKCAQHNSRRQGDNLRSNWIKATLQPLSHAGFV